jgi:hypothetical protein
VALLHPRQLLDLLPANPLGQLMQSAHPLGQGAELFFFYLVGLSVPGVHVCVPEQIEEPFLLFGIFGENCEKGRVRVAGFSAQLGQFVHFRFVANEHQEDRVVGLLGGLVEHEGGLAVSFPFDIGWAVGTSSTMMSVTRFSSSRLCSGRCAGERFMSRIYPGG